MNQETNARIPVLIGVGQINDRADTGGKALDSLALMVSAARLAGADAGANLLAQTDWLGVVSQISFPEYSGSLTGLLAQKLGIAPESATETAQPSGDSPLLLLNEAANAIGRGQAQVALIVGGEALRTAAKATPGGTALPKRAPAQLEVRHRYGLRSPAEVYPLYENAGRAHYGQSMEEGQMETGRLWSLFSAVAEANPAAWIRQRRTANEIATTSADNRPIAFPYTKLMVANAAVNQGAALIVCSLAVALDAGVPASRMVYLGRGAAAHEDEDPLRRASYGESASMRVSIERAMALNGLQVGDLDHVELYSCFPCVPKMARRVLGWPLERAASVVGGLTFGGGPIGNYMTHAAASMVLRLRQGGGNGLLFANGGYATHNHTMLLTTTAQPAGTFPQQFDCQAEADAARGPVPELLERFDGEATIETYTVLYERDGAPRLGFVLARTADGRRVPAQVPAHDQATIAALHSGEREAVGRRGMVRNDGELNRWSFLP